MLETCPFQWVERRKDRSQNLFGKDWSMKGKGARWVLSVGGGEKQKKGEGNRITLLEKNGHPLMGKGKKKEKREPNNRDDGGHGGGEGKREKLKSIRKRKRQSLFAI